jgi:hypothetical protein
MPLTGLTIDEGPHNMDGMLLHARHGTDPVEAFISRRVMDIWMEPIEPPGRRKSLPRAQYNALGKANLAAIERIVNFKYERGAAFNRQHPFVDVLYSDIAESGELLDAGELGEQDVVPAALVHTPRRRMRHKRAMLAIASGLVALQVKVTRLARGLKMVERRRLWSGRPAAKVVEVVRASYNERCPERS